MYTAQKNNKKLKVTSELQIISFFYFESHGNYKLFSLKTE